MPSELALPRLDDVVVGPWLAEDITLLECRPYDFCRARKEGGNIGASVCGGLAWARFSP